MKICLFNDLHIEFTNGEWTPPDPSTFDVMVLAGDIYPIKMLDQDEVAPFIKELASLEKPVLWVAGNHEYYGTSVRLMGPYILREKLAKHAPNVQFLNTKKVDIDGVHFFGGTMWTDFGPRKERVSHKATALRRMNDYRFISWDIPNWGNEDNIWSPTHAEEQHKRFMKSLKEWLRRKDLTGKRVVITHHSPIESRNERFLDSSLKYAYESLDCKKIMLQYNIDVWCHGHTHECRDEMFKNTRVVSNARGYRNIPYHTHLIKGFKEEGLIIEI